jgi:hypothetical protein
MFFAEIDGEKNEVPGINLSGYPTVLYFPPDGSMQYEEYMGDLTVQLMQEFLDGKIKDWEKKHPSRDEPRRIRTKRML